MVYQPDGGIRLGPYGYAGGPTNAYHGPWLGYGIVNVTGASQTAIWANAGSAMLAGTYYTYDISIRNAGSGADRFGVKATGAATNTWVVAYSHGTSNVTFYEGSYSFYSERRPKAIVPTYTGKSADQKTERSKRPTAARKQTFKEKAELAAMEETITAAETVVADLEATLQDPAIFKDRAAEVPAMVIKLEGGRDEVNRLYARWAQLSAIPAG